MELLLRAKHWQIFTTLAAIGIFSKLFSSSSGNELILDIGYIIGNITIISWYVFIGIQFRKKIKSKLTFLFGLFLCSTAIVIGIGIIPVLLFDRVELSMMLEDKLLFFTLFGLSIFSVFNLAIFPAKALRILEIGDDIDINDYFVDIFKLLFWPIGIWNIQPRLNKIATQLPG